jgi:hypothetical protein
MITVRYADGASITFPAPGGTLRSRSPSPQRRVPDPVTPPPAARTQPRTPSPQRATPSEIRRQLRDLDEENSNLTRQLLQAQRDLDLARTCQAAAEEAVTRTTQREAELNSMSFRCNREYIELVPRILGFDFPVLPTGQVYHCAPCQEEHTATGYHACDTCGSKICAKSFLSAIMTSMTTVARSIWEQDVAMKAPFFSCFNCRSEVNLQAFGIPATPSTPAAAPAPAPGPGLVIPVVPTLVAPVPVRTRRQPPRAAATANPVVVLDADTTEDDESDPEFDPTRRVATNWNPTGAI